MSQALDQPKNAEPSAEYLRLVADRAIEVFGDSGAAMRWLGIPVAALQYATPISLLCRSEGVDAVLTILGRIEHGVF